MISDLSRLFEIRTGKAVCFFTGRFLSRYLVSIIPVYHTAKNNNLVPSVCLPVSVSCSTSLNYLLLFFLLVTQPNA